MPAPIKPRTQAPHGMSRRDFLTLGTAATGLGAFGLTLPDTALATASAADTNWHAGQLAHLIPAASHDRFLIKASFQAPLARAPWVIVNGKRVAGEPTDTAGRFWRFDVRGLQPATQYTLRIVDAGGKPLADAWPLKTFPAPNATPARLRILAYTCAGGYDGPSIAGKTAWLDMAARRRLLARGMAFAPDAVIANGDHIYWDLQTSQNKPFARQVRELMWTKFGGALDMSVPMSYPKNEAIFTRVCDYQIGGLYGTTLRSTPAYFLTDDHDTFENDEFDDKVATLPPEPYGLIGAELTQHRYYPEFLPDANRPVWLPGGDKAGMPVDTNSAFGTLRYGSLLEAVLYDCRRFLDNKGMHARVVPQWVEDWLVARTRAEDTAHFFHVPSLPFAYSSGKLGDWYPDLLDTKTGRLVGNQPKPGWQTGWHAQHQRLVAALGQQKQRAAVIVQGDFHASAVGAMSRSAELEFAHPVHAIMTGTLGTGDMGFPSAFRSIETTPALSVAMQEALRPTEKNGFTIIDVTPEKMTFSLFLWRPPEPVDAIDTLQPALVYEVPRLA
ncbi:alkaline phosphatase D family protein [Ralstonia insidiosa]|jgi:hypothetical protein|uniref:alkaline phosphatase D family protein n=1 Tax=Ralstonia TaxID=48736 RepID=UPI0006648A5B|nr:twin-arginine translocation signal domain-containing protein [Ralstonia insidiosa]KMW45694.1 LigA [Ralstonia sp. MD27]MBX3772549.1 alkaline phosphatase D family protein [Ralstonia pickettii]NOZ19230.1 twin-arginine translocation signal domain-containing protein [Betaproteobacteria bacterium]MBA9857205.1 twin-arginine translocation signal domain-containing protein [Ralstonia insidiosa]MBA9870307.1 twin-arginine translocation signal domain-containing protein [Ralstonia insidiosa]